MSRSYDELMMHLSEESSAVGMVALLKRHSARTAPRYTLAAFSVSLYNFTSHGFCILLHTLAADLGV